MPNEYHFLLAAKRKTLNRLIQSRPVLPPPDTFADELPLVLVGVSAFGCGCGACAADKSSFCNGVVVALMLFVRVGLCSLGGGESKSALDDDDIDA